MTVNHDNSSDPLGLGRPLRVLVVDDERDTLEMLEMLLGSLGWNVTLAASFRQAVEAFDNGGADLVLSDITLPELDGYRLISALRERAGGYLPAVAISGLSQAEDVERSLAAGFDAHLTKPFEMTKLYDALARIRDGREP
jgi:CheY-like chemotaxis protein